MFTPPKKRDSPTPPKIPGVSANPHKMFYALAYPQQDFMVVPKIVSFKNDPKIFVNGSYLQSVVFLGIPKHSKTYNFGGKSHLEIFLDHF